MAKKRKASLGEQLHTISVNYPADWWQHFKLRWFPKWLTRKYPVEYKTVSYDIKALYSTLKPSLPEYRSNVIFLRRLNNTQV